MNGCWQEGMAQPRRLYSEPGERNEKDGGRLRYHVLAAHAMIGGEDRLAGYVARLEVGECARILAASPLPLSELAAGGAASRVGADEGRGFDEVIRAWTLRVLAYVESG